MTNEIPRRRGTPAQRAIAAQAIRSIRRTTPTSGLRCLHHAADDLARTAAIRLDAGFTAEATDTTPVPIPVSVRARFPARSADSTSRSSIGPVAPASRATAQTWSRAVRVRSRRRRPAR